MGAGASSDLVEKANTASIDDLKAAVAALPAETQAKLREAATPRASAEELTCYCGATKISVTGEAAMKVFCHVRTRLFRTRKAQTAPFAVARLTDTLVPNPHSATTAGGGEARLRRRPAFTRRIR